MQELNSKAEAKFNKLKNQAKVKIAALSRELEQMKGGKGEVQHNTSQVSCLLHCLVCDSF